MRGGYRAVITDAASESSWTAGYDGRPTGSLTEYAEHGQREVDLPAADAYTAVIDHLWVDQSRNRDRRFCGYACVSRGSGGSAGRRLPLGGFPGRPRGRGG
ncbi:MAG TPA: hypothetical protein VF486_11815 [Actinomycetes bacterium]